VRKFNFNKRTLILVGNDKIGKRSYLKISSKEFDLSSFDFTMDASTSIFRIYRLIKNRRITLRCFFIISFSEVMRKNAPPLKYANKIRSNEDLHNLIRKNSYGRVILFRSGLVINRKNLSLGVPFFNIHCASIPEYAGLCSIYRALKDGALNQQCCLHLVTTKIDDSSEILDTEPYILDQDRSYFWNEETAYEAGIRLLMRLIADAQ